MVTPASCEHVDVRLRVWTKLPPDRRLGDTDYRGERCPTRHSLARRSGWTAELEYHFRSDASGTSIASKVSRSLSRVARNHQRAPAATRPTRTGALVARRRSSTYLFAAFVPRSWPSFWPVPWPRRPGAERRPRQLLPHQTHQAPCATTRAASRARSAVHPGRPTG